MIGKHVLDFVVDEEREIASELMKLITNGKPQMGNDLHIKRKDGSSFHSIWNAMPMFDDNNEYMGFTTTGVDLTEIDKLRDELATKEKFETLGELAANLAHDIKNPLNVIKQSIEVIQLKVKDENISNDFQRTHRAIKRISHQVDQVLNYVKKQPLQIKDTTVLTTIKESLEMDIIPDNISIELPENDVDVKWDETMMSVVFTNVFLNAIQAIGKDKAKISIRISEENNLIKIEIEDTGPNIPEEDLDKIFDPLFTTKMQGTGLGLTGCKNIVARHKGTISIKNNPVIFTIKIPKK